MDKHEQATGADLQGLAEYTDAASPTRIASRNEDARQMLSVIEHYDPILRRALFETALEAAIAEETNSAHKRPSANSIRLARKIGLMMAGQKDIPALRADETEMSDEQ